MKRFPAMIGLIAWGKYSRLLLTVLLVAWVTEAAQAGWLLVAGSQEYDQATSTGFQASDLYSSSEASVNNSGIAVGMVKKYDSGSSLGSRAVHWDGLGTAIELENLGNASSGATSSQAYDINDAGIAVGHAKKYESGVSRGYRAVRWDASGNVTELGDLGVKSDDGFTVAKANAVNAAGTAVGYANKYESGSVNDKGYRAVRWDASGTDATELGNLGLRDDGVSISIAQAINDTGTAVGYVHKYEDGADKGSRAVRWDASGVVTELGNLGTDSSGCTSRSSLARAINAAGTAVGVAEKYVDGVSKGDRAVRWDASGAVATELDTLGDFFGKTYAGAFAVNASGTAVGYSDKYIGHSDKGSRAVRWDASGTAATELDTLGTTTGDETGGTSAQAAAVNDVGTAVGWSNKYVDQVNMGQRAVIWLPDASVIDLNDLGVAPVSGDGLWTLVIAGAISADGWVTGWGTFDPDGDGALSSYNRLWVTQVGLGGTWTNAAGGTWGRGPNWSTGTPAMQVGDATFDLDETYTVDLDRDETTKTIAINAGTVTINCNGHTLTTENGISIADGAILKQANKIASDIVNAGTIAPGNSPGTLDITGNLTNIGTLEFEVGSSLDYDQINLTGAFSAGGTIAVILLDGYTPTEGDLFDIMNFGSFINNGYTFDWSHATLPAGLAWDTTIFATTGNIGVMGVPEPSVFVLLTLSAVFISAFTLLRRR